MKFLRWLLLPFSLLYALVVIIRNWCYDAGWFKSERFDLPIISVGNLAVGGAGKSPMTEYLVRLIKSDHHLATLSRGYGRKTKGYLVAEAGYTAVEVGDEPAQFKQKFPEVTVAVCENRAEGIRQLIPHHNLIILDDAYQHRAVQPGLSILLMEYSRLNEPHWLLPAGNLREPYSGRLRADLIVISKCPPQLSKQQQHNLLKQIGAFPHQQVYFTAINYLPLQSLNGTEGLPWPDADTTVFLLTGIANPTPMQAELEYYTTHIVPHNYPDHHQFSLKNIVKLAEEYKACPSAKKLIITTEKDAQRLRSTELQAQLSALPVAVLPIGIQFLNGAGPAFNEMILNYVREHTTHSDLY